MEYRIDRSADRRGEEEEEEGEEECRGKWELAGRAKSTRSKDDRGGQV